MAELVNLAKEILHHAEKLQAELEAIQAPQPSLAAGGPITYPDTIQHHKIFEARSAIADKSQDLLQLAQGPADHIRLICGPHRCRTTLLKVIQHFKIAELVPQDGSLSFSELSAKINVHQAILERVLRYGFSFNVFKEEPVGHIRHTALSQAIVPLYGWMINMNRRDVDAGFNEWPKAMEVYSEPAKPGVRQEPYCVAKGDNKQFFETISEEPNGMEDFAEGMRSTAALSTGGGAGYAVFLNGYDWASLGDGPIVDLGGGNGHVSFAIAKENPKLHIVVEDLPGNEGSFHELVPDELKGRVTYQVQDFFQPQAKDVGATLFFMKSIIHDWLDPDAMRILKNLMPYVEKGAKLLIIDRVLPEPGKKLTLWESTAHFTDLMMWTMLDAKERYKDQWAALLKKTDERLRMLKVNRPPGSEFSLMEIGL